MLKGLFALLGRQPAVRRSPAEQRRVDAASSQLALYHFATCPYCVRVRRTIRRLDLQIELRDAHHPQYRQELRELGGLYQTPCLRIEAGPGETRWLYESADIIRYLRNRFTRFHQ